MQGCCFPASCIQAEYRQIQVGYSHMGSVNLWACHDGSLLLSEKAVCSYLIGPMSVGDERSIFRCKPFCGCSLLHPGQPPLLVNTHFAPEGRPYTEAAAGAASAAPSLGSELKKRPLTTKPFEARYPPGAVSLSPDIAQPASKPDEIQPIFGQAMQLLDDGLPATEAANGNDPAWFRSTSARPDLQAATSVGPGWDSPESSTHPRGVSGRTPVAPLPAMSLPPPLRMGSKSLAAGDVELAGTA